MNVQKVGFGGSCHWCTEAIFQSLIGVENVDQGWISAVEDSTYSEAIIVYFDSSIIKLSTLIEVHLRTHSCTSNHAMRLKYRSAIYTFNNKQYDLCVRLLKAQQKNFPAPLITQVLQFSSFKLNDEKYLNYYSKNPDKPFCRNVIDPKLKILLSRFSSYVKA